MSGFTADDVRHLAALARLELGPGEIDTFTRELGEILEFATQVQRVQTAAVTGDNVQGVTPQAPPREDIRTPSLHHDDVLAAAPDADPATGLFKVPRVLATAVSERPPRSEE